jgi:hypothetical protein
VGALQVRQGVFGRVEASEKVNVHELVENLHVLDLLKEEMGRDPCVQDQNVYLMKELKSFVDKVSKICVKLDLDSYGEKEMGITNRHRPPSSNVF